MTNLVFFLAWCSLVFCPRNMEIPLLLFNAATCLSAFRPVRATSRETAGPPDVACGRSPVGHILQVIPSHCPFPDSFRQQFGFKTLYEQRFNFLIECYAIFYALRSQRVHLGHQEKIVVRIRLLLAGKWQNPFQGEMA